MIHFDGFSLLLVVTFSWLGYVVGWRRCRAEIRSRFILTRSHLANDAEVIARAREAKTMH